MTIYQKIRRDNIVLKAEKYWRNMEWMNLSI